MMVTHLSKSYEVLSHIRELGVGTEITTTKIKDKAPWLSVGAISGALSSFCSEGRLEFIGTDKSVKRGRKPNVYKVLASINDDRTFHKEPSDYQRHRKSGTGKKVIDKIPLKKVRVDDSVDQILSLVSSMQDTITNLQERNLELVKNPDLTVLSESLLWQEIIRRRQEEGRHLSQRGKKKAQKVMKEMTESAVAQEA